MGNVQHGSQGKEQPAAQEGDMVENGLYYGNYRLINRLE